MTDKVTHQQVQMTDTLTTHYFTQAVYVNRILCDFIPSESSAVVYCVQLGSDYLRENRRQQLHFHSLQAEPEGVRNE